MKIVYFCSQNLNVREVFLCELARGSMGETSARGEGILGSYICCEAYGVIDIFLSNTLLSDILHSFKAGKLKYFHSKASGYNICNACLNLGGDLMVKIKSGEKKIGF
jgi:hypothetical protein